MVAGDILGLLRWLNSVFLHVCQRSRFLRLTGFVFLTARQPQQGHHNQRCTDNHEHVRHLTKKDQPNRYGTHQTAVLCTGNLIAQSYCFPQRDKQLRKSRHTPE